METAQETSNLNDENSEMDNIEHNSSVIEADAIDGLFSKAMTDTLIVDESLMDKELETTSDTIPITSDILAFTSNASQTHISRDNISQETSKVRSDFPFKILEELKEILNDHNLNIDKILSDITLEEEKSNIMIEDLSNLIQIDFKKFEKEFKSKNEEFDFLKERISDVTVHNYFSDDSIKNFLFGSNMQQFSELEVKERFKKLLSYRKKYAIMCLVYHTTKINQSLPEKILFLRTICNDLENDVIRFNYMVQNKMLKKILECNEKELAEKILKGAFKELHKIQLKELSIDDNTDENMFLPDENESMKEERMDLNPARSNDGIVAKALYDYEDSKKNAISFRSGDEITNISKFDTNWWMGTKCGKVGFFPANYVQIIENTTNDPNINSNSTDTSALALFNYNGGADDEISFNKDDVITKINKTNEYWWEGQLEGHEKRGLFPANYVKVITLKRSRKTFKNAKTTVGSIPRETVETIQPQDNNSLLSIKEETPGSKSSENIEYLCLDKNLEMTCNLPQHTNTSQKPSHMGKRKKYAKIDISQPTNFIHIGGINMENNKMIDNAEQLEPEARKKLGLMESEDEQATCAVDISEPTDFIHIAGMTIEEGTGTKLVDNTNKIDEDVKLKLGILEPEEIQKYNEAEPKVCQKEVTKQKKGRHKKIDKSAISQPTNFVHVTGVERGTKMVDNTELMDPEVMQKLKMTRTGENQPPN